MREFFQAQMDYVFFFYGLGFVLFAGVAFLLWRKEKLSYWFWLFLFGLMHGLNKWCDMLMVSFPASPPVTIAMLWLLLVSFACLIEAGRSAAALVSRLRIRAALLYPCIALAIGCGWLGCGLPCVNAMMRYTLGFCGGLLCAYALGCIAREKAKAGLDARGLGFVAALLAIYACTQVFVPRAALFPASWVNADLFLVHLQFPIHFLRGILACAMAFCAWLCYRPNSSYAKEMTAVFAFIVLFGWVFVAGEGRVADKSSRDTLMSLTRITASAVNPKRVAALTMTAADISAPDYQRLREQFLAFSAAAYDTRVRWFYLMMRTGSVLNLVVDGVVAGTFGHVDPGSAEMEYKDPPLDFMRAFNEKNERIFGPYTDSYGMFKTAVVPILDAGSKKVLALFCVDVDATQWLAEIYRRRLSAVGMVLLLALLAIVFFVALESAQAAFFDIGVSQSNLHRTQQQLAQSEKLAAIGQLAAGIAHEINNPLGFVKSNLATFEKYMQKIKAFYREITEGVPIADAAHKQKIEFVLGECDAVLSDSNKGLERIRKTIFDLKTYARGDSEEIDWVDLVEVVESALNLVSNELKYKAEVVKDYAEVSRVSGSAQRLGQVFINILVNAAQSIAEKGTVGVRVYELDNTVFAEIKDSGSGMSEETMKKIFDPFFTTKPVGVGTGLGLSVSQEIVKKYHGELRVSSELGKGTTFTVSFPAVKG